MGTTKPRHCPAPGTIHVWIQTAARAHTKKLVLLGAKAKQANIAMKNLEAEWDREEKKLACEANVSTKLLVLVNQEEECQFA